MDPLKKRIRAYLEAKGVPVSRDELLRVATATGVDRDEVYRVTKEIQDLVDYGDCDIGTWYGYSGISDKEAIARGEKKTLWLHFYKMTPEEKVQKIVDLAWFDS